jgi:hypothetical protein
MRTKYFAILQVISAPWHGLHTIASNRYNCIVGKADVFVNNSAAHVVVPE